jgi:UvrD-like helicase C-terminal domain
MFEILQYNEFDLSTVKQKYAKVVAYLQAGDFKRAEVKKMNPTGYFRAKLDQENRLLFKFVEHNQRRYLLLLDVILNHNYEKSRFLRGVDVDEKRLSALADAKSIPPTDIEKLRYVNEHKKPLHFLDKFISFDDTQQAILTHHTPLIIIGSAGSGKTALTLERLKMLKGNVAYLSLSSFLVENAESLYYAAGYDNQNQEVDFLSFKDYIYSLKIPSGKEINFKIFEGFCQRYKSQIQTKEYYKIFEEFKGVITGMNAAKPYLSQEEYFALGVKQSVFSKDSRVEIYALFERYLLFLTNEGYYDSNLLAHEYSSLCKPKYDYIVVDEVQDLTNAQLSLVMRSLKNPVGFVFCGDANQIVHPNFFSWSSLKTMFYRSDIQGDIIRILQTNYRNSKEVTQIANKLLKIKNLRFGSIDKESTHLVNSIADTEGKVEFLEDKDKLKQELNQRTKDSANFAVLVMNNDDKAEAQRFFQTPLIFSIHEAKGLEYDNIIIHNFISTYEKEFREISDSIQPEALEQDLVFGRNRDKENKELETYKFYINSFYVGITRAVKNLYLIEKNAKHPILRLLGLLKTKETVQITASKSSVEDWKKEARKLEIQGKQEQSDAIRKMIALQENKPHLSPEELEALKKEALNPEHFNNQAKKKLYQYAISSGEMHLIVQLNALKYPEARKFLESIDRHLTQLSTDIKNERLDNVQRFVKQYGFDLPNKEGETPLFIAARLGAVNILQFLLDNGDNPLKAHQDKNIFVAVTRLYILSAYNQGLTQGKGYDLKITQSQAVPLSKMAAVYNALSPKSIQVVADGRLHKISKFSMEYFLLVFMDSTYNDILTVKWAALEYRIKAYRKFYGDDYFTQQMQAHKERSRGLRMDDFVDFLEPLDKLLPEYRRKRAYINSILSKNEIQSTNFYARPLFKRIERGVYILNPDLKIIYDSKAAE